MPSLAKIIKETDTLGWAEFEVTDIDSRLEMLIKEELEAKASSKIVEFLEFDYYLWHFPILNLEYKKMGVDCLEWNAKVYTVADVEVYMREQKHTRFIRGKPLYNLRIGHMIIGYYEQLFEPAEIEIEPIHLFTTPILLLRGLTEGITQPQGTEIVNHHDNTSFYEVSAFLQIVKLHDPFIS